MKRYSFLPSARWLGWFLAVCTMATVCVGLGQWQYGRHLERQAQIQRILNNYDAPPLEQSKALSLMERLGEDQEWTRVELVGQYLPEGQRIVRNRPNGQPGYEVLIPSQVEGSAVVAVDRGWLPIGNNKAGYPDTVPNAPQGKITLTAHLRPSEPELNRDAPTGQIATINLPLFASETQLNILSGAYPLMETETPAPPTRPEALPKPSLDPRSYLSYSWLWYVFATLFFVGLAYSARQEAKVIYGEVGETNDPGHGNSGEEPVRITKLKSSKTSKNQQVRKQLSTEEFEDALLDQWEEEQSNRDQNSPGAQK